MMNAPKLCCAAGLVLLFVPDLAMARKAGISGKSVSGCTPCHSENPTAGVTVEVTGPATLAPNATGNYTLTLKGGPLVKGGFNLSATGAKALVAGTGSKLLNGELTHTAPKSPVNNEVTFAFRITANATPGEIEIFAASNSVNGDDNNTSADQWNTTTGSIKVVSPAIDAGPDPLVDAGSESPDAGPGTTNPPVTPSGNDDPPLVSDEPLPSAQSKGGCAGGGLSLAPFALAAWFFARRSRREKFPSA